MITTVTLNPAIDRILYVEALRENEVNRISSVKLWPGGKGINVSKVIKMLGSEVTAAGLLAGKNGSWVGESLIELGIDTDFLYVSGETRVNTKIYDTVKGFTTDLNEAGPYVDESCLQPLSELIGKLAAKSRVIVFSGSLPAGMPRDTYKVLTEAAGQTKCKVLLDTSGECLLRGLEAKPCMVKPNKGELQDILGQKLVTREQVINGASELIKKGINTVLVSMGAEGSLLVEKDIVLFAENIPVEVKGTVGAGDSMVGAFAHAIERELPEEEALRMAAACSNACVHFGSSSEIDKQTVYSYMERIKIQKL